MKQMNSICIYLLLLYSTQLYVVGATVRIRKISNLEEAIDKGLPKAITRTVVSCN